MKLLPVSRGRNAEHITFDAIVSGLQSIVAERPGFAGMTANRLGGLRPVGDAKKAFAQAETLAAALQAAMYDEALLNNVAEIRITDNEVYTNSFGRAVIFYRADNGERATYYVGRENHTLMQTGAEDTYNPRDLIRSGICETVIFPDGLKRIAREVQRDEEHAQRMEALRKESDEVDVDGRQDLDIIGSFAPKRLCSSQRLTHINY